MQLLALPALYLPHEDVRHLTPITTSTPPHPSASRAPCCCSWDCSLLAASSDGVSRGTQSWVISTASALVGAVTLAVGVVLKMTSRVEDVFFDGCVMGLGGSCFAISVIGIVGCKWESKCLLRMYAFALLALLAALLGVGLYLLIDARMPSLSG